jgi:hypothetical protein
MDRTDTAIRSHAARLRIILKKPKSTQRPPPEGEAKLFSTALLFLLEGNFMPARESEPPRQPASPRPPSPPPSRPTEPPRQPKPSRQYAKRVPRPNRAKGTWYVSFENREPGSGKRPQARVTETYPTEWEAKVFARVKLAEGSSVNAGTLNPHRPKRTITSKQIRDWLNEPDG